LERKTGIKMASGSWPTTTCLISAKSKSSSLNRGEEDECVEEIG